MPDSHTATTPAPATTPEAAPKRSTEHVLVMDGLRGIAIVLVVLFHYWQMSFYVIPLPGKYDLQFVQYSGFLGVELFFFISAFCLFLPVASGRVPTLKRFAYRRAIKILPSYFLALLVFGFLITDLYPSTWEHGKFADLLMHLLFLQNMTDATHGSFIGVLWSLAVEVQFYVFFPLLAWVFVRRPLPTAAVMIAISVFYREWNRDGAADGLGIQADFLPAFLDLFAYGMLAAWMVAWVRRRPLAAMRVRAPLTAVAVLTFVVILFVFDWAEAIRGNIETGVWQSENRAYIGALFTMLAVASAFALPQWRAVLGNRVLVFFSTISYNLYLWHQAVGIFIIKRDWWPADTPVATDDPQWRWSFFLVAVAASIAVATLVTYLFERPFLHHGVRGTLARGQARLRNGGKLPAGFQSIETPSEHADHKAAEEAGEPASLEEEVEAEAAAAVAEAEVGGPGGKAEPAAT
ncbi:MAG: acyltransferase [Solirubrobacteraceae bacterium]|nr:acyltransferase [Solirubrobacteraceae bacterium]